MRIQNLSGAMLTMVVALSATGCDALTGETRTVTQSVDLDHAESVDVELKMGAGELAVGGGSEKLMSATFRFNVPSWEPRLDYQSGAVGRLRVEQPSGAAGWGNTENKWDLRLNDRLPMSLTAHLGAGEATMKMGTMNLRGLAIHQGVGELKLDLRGAPGHSYDVTVHGGVGSANIRLPRSVAIVATAKGGLGSISVRGLEKRGGAWYNPDHEHDPVAIHLDIQGGVGEIAISAEAIDPS